MSKSKRWVKLADRLPWAKIEKEYNKRLRNSHCGAGNKPARMVVGALIVKHVENLSDKKTIQAIQENPYMQYLLGLSKFTEKPVFVPELFVLIRKRLDQNFFNMLTLMLSEADGSKPKNEPRGIPEATVIRDCFHVVKRGGEGCEEVRLRLKREAVKDVNSLRAIFRNKKLTKETAKQKFKEWYEKVASCTLREVKSVRDTIRFYEDEILNYFDGRKTNASAESLNSKIKCFRAQVKGVIDIPFFMYRLATVLVSVCTAIPQGLSGAPYLPTISVPIRY